ncbi:MAG: hypothetical protein OIF54_17920 [Cohaesibacter sp.]|nr:hypothetical protein [Cohaesibacter sp.]
MPADLAAQCQDPGVKAGRDARRELARNRAALADCKKRHRDMVTFYGDVRQLHNGEEIGSLD